MRVFRSTPRSFWAVWRKACDALGFHPGPPHSLRHTGPSFDMLEQGVDQKPYRTERQVQTRGRWANSESVLRYWKTFVYLKALSEVPDRVRRLGQKRMKALGSRPSAARE